MLFEPLAVIGGDDRPACRRAVPRRQRRIEAADQFVGPCDLAVVRPAGVARRVRLGRLVWIVRVVEVDPRETTLRSRTRQPGRRFVDRCVASLLDGVEESRVVFADLESIRIVGKPAGQTRLPGQHDRRDECTGPEPALLKDVCEHAARSWRAAGRRCREFHAPPGRDRSRARRATDVSAAPAPRRAARSRLRARVDPG